jgi:hypothetical protein
MWNESTTYGDWRDLSVLAASSVDIMCGLNSIYSHNIANAAPTEMKRVLAASGVAVIANYSGFMGDPILTLARAGVKVGLTVVMYTEGQEGFGAYTASAEADATGAVRVSTAVSLPEPRQSLATPAVAAPTADHKELYPTSLPANVVMFAKTSTCFHRVELPERSVRKHHGDSTYTEASVYRFLDEYTGQHFGPTVMSRFTDGHFPQLRKGRHDSPQLVPLWKTFIRDNNREPQHFLKEQSGRGEGWSGRTGEIEVFHIQRHEVEDFGAFVERVNSLEQQQIDMGCLNFCKVAGGLCMAGSSAGGRAGGTHIIG